MGLNGYVLCRPQGGINDMLCQIEHCCRYAEKFGRSVIVDTHYPKAIHFRDKFSNYFVSRQRRLILDTTEIDLHEANVSVYPHCVRGNLFDYDFHFSWDVRRYVESNSLTPLTFDPDKDYEEKYLLHHTGGGGQLSVNALQRLRLHDSVVDKLVERLKSINQQYVAIHIRNTDYETDYRDALHEMSGLSGVPVLVCTDNQETLNDAFEIIGRDRVISFSNLDAGDDKRLHFFSDDAIARERNIDALVDLLLLAFSSYLVILQLKKNVEAPFGGYSGFSVLANLLHNDRTTLLAMLNREDRVIGQFAGSLL